MKKVTAPVEIKNCTFNGPVRSDKESEALLILAKALHENSRALRQVSASIKDAGCMIYVGSNEEAV